MKLFKKGLIIAMAMFAVQGCTDYRTIKVGWVGKVVDNTGVSKETFQAGTRNIGWAALYTKQLVLLDTSVELIPLTLDIRMADDQTLNVEMIVKTRLDVKDETGVSAMFGMVTPVKVTKYEQKIPLSLIYSKLGQDLVRRTMVEVIAPHTLESFRKDRRDINNTIEKVLAKRFKKTPLMMIGATINKVGYPEAYITQADNIKVAAMSVELKRNEEQARRGRLAEEEASIEIDRRVRLAKAETIALENKATAKGINPILMEYRKLELEDKRLDIDMIFAQAAAKGSNKVIYYPMGQKPDYVDISLGRQ